MQDLKRDLSVLTISWAFWCVLWWLIVTFVSQYPISTWASGGRAAFVFLCFLGFFPGALMVHLFEHSAKADEKAHREAMGIKEPEPDYQNKDAYDPNIG
jgi:hypothetical protein